MMNNFGELEENTKKCGFCSASCEKKCSNCKKIGYCSSEHQRSHRKEHKDECYPAVEMKDDRFGYYLAATRTIIAGEVIFNENPLVTSPFGTVEDRHPTCLGCCKALAGTFGDGGQICKICGWPLCKESCEQILSHSENECKIFHAQKAKPTAFTCQSKSPVPVPLLIVYDCIKVLRILLLKQANPRTFEKILSLESHVQNRKIFYTDVLERNIVSSFIHKTCKMDKIEWPEEFINRIYGVVKINCCEQSCNQIVPGIVMESLIYEKASKLCHSCISNTKSVKKAKATNQIIATTEIKRGEMLSQFYGSYTAYWKGIPERRIRLYENYYFWCTCSRCSDPTELGTNFSAIKCKNSNSKCTGYFLPRNALEATASETIWRCTSENCGAKKKYSILVKVVVGILNEIDKSNSLADKLKIVDKHASVSVHENHFTLMKLRYDILPLLCKELVAPSEVGLEGFDLVQKLTMFAKLNLKLAEKFSPGLSTQRGILLFYLAQGLGQSYKRTNYTDMTKFLEDFKENESIREEAKSILKLMPEGSEGNKFYKALLKQKVPAEMQDFLKAVVDLKV